MELRANPERGNQQRPFVIAWPIDAWRDIVFHAWTGREHLEWLGPNGVSRYPMAPTWPLEKLSTITLEERNAQTLLTIEWVPLNATEAERKSFDERHESMRNGWTGTLARLTDHLRGQREAAKA
jgi:uncharacterized protein YndB with AHSA1/START domain